MTSLYHIIGWLLVALLLAFYMAYRYYKDGPVERAHRKLAADAMGVIESNVKRLASVQTASEKGIYYREVPTFLFGKDSRVERLFTGHGIDVLLTYMKPNAVYERHKHAKNAQIFIPVSGKFSINIYDKLSDTEPNVIKSLSRSDTGDPMSNDIVCYVQPGQVHEIVANECGELNEFCVEFLSVTIPPFSETEQYATIQRGAMPRRREA